jgi:hypothetical protein
MGCLKRFEEVGLNALGYNLIKACFMPPELVQRRGVRDVIGGCDKILTNKSYPQWKKLSAASHPFSSLPSRVFWTENIERPVHRLGYRYQRQFKKCLSILGNCHYAQHPFVNHRVRTISPEPDGSTKNSSFGRVGSYSSLRVHSTPKKR